MATTRIQIHQAVNDLRTIWEYYGDTFDDQRRADTDRIKEPFDDKEWHSIIKQANADEDSKRRSSWE